MFSVESLRLGIPEDCSALAYGAVLLDRVLYDPVEQFAKELSCPHGNYEKLSCLNRQCCVRSLSFLLIDNTV